MNSVQSAVRRLERVLPLKPSLAMILGSGFQSVLDSAEILFRIDFRNIPGFPRTTVPGHRGALLLVRLAGVPVIALAGRVHFYEGHPMERVTFPIRVLAGFGVKALLLTNAAGGINPKFRAGDFMALSDHINLMGVNPLRPPASSRAEIPFVDLTQVYARDLNALLKIAARRVNVRLRSGIYAAVSGPSYETPAEIRAFAHLGADAVGMSTVPEAVVARCCGIKVAAISCITNAAAGRNKKPISHSEVLAIGESVRQRANRLLTEFVRLCAPRHERT